MRSLLDDCRRLLCCQFRNRPCPHTTIAPVPSAIPTPAPGSPPFSHSLAASPRAGELCVSRTQESHPYNGDHDLSHRNVVRTNQRGRHTARIRGVRG